MAKKFRFSLEGVRKVRAHDCDARRRDVANAARAMSSAEKQIGELNDMLQSTVEQTRAEQQGKRLDMPSLCGNRSYQSYLHRRILESQDVLAEKQRAFEAERARLAEASKRLKAIEKVRDKRWARHLTEVNREEQAASDEIATQRYIRQAAEPRALARAALQHPQSSWGDRA